MVSYTRVTAAEYRQALDALPYGKRLPGAVYLIDPGEDAAIPSLLRITVAELRKRLEIGSDFNLLKFHTSSPKISFLAYPDFEKQLHPTLAEAVIVDLITGKTRRDDYRGRANPPILHRKETFLPPDHPLHAKFAKLTREEETADLLEDTVRIGFQLNWDRILAEKGLGFKGHRLIETGEAVSPTPASPQKKIHRHKTALVRRDISKPVKTLIELGQLRRGESFFDYGCGHGGDVEAIGKLGHESRGWDPVHAPDSPKQSADVVNLGFVLNVIEDAAERVEAVIDAWQHARRVLLVSTLIAGQEAYDDIRALLTRIKIDLKRLFVFVIDHTTGPEHQLLFFKERFLANDHPDRPKMDRFSAKLRKLGLREETIGFGPTKEKWNEFLKLERGIHPA